MLAPYRKEAGLQPRKPSYPNWDGSDGHVGGHYLSALAINAATGNEECRKRMEYMISELQLVLEANNQRHEAWCHNEVRALSILHVGKNIFSGWRKYYSGC
jgi:uncharacterized protein